MLSDIMSSGRQKGYKLHAKFVLFCSKMLLYKGSIREWKLESERTPLFVRSGTRRAEGTKRLYGTLSATLVVLWFCYPIV
jgi:hypothetical protein